MRDEQQNRDEGKHRGIFGAEDPDANPLMILASYAATVAVVGFFTGAACVFLPYYFAADSTSRYQARRNTEAMLEHDTSMFVKWRFWAGAAVGSGGTIAALIVFNSRKKD